jgi:hypothetical protein
LLTSLQVHQNSLHKLVGTHVMFFDTTPIGRILNRFSKVRRWAHMPSSSRLHISDCRAVRCNLSVEVL